jgi:hypothetical protein
MSFFLSLVFSSVGVVFMIAGKRTYQTVYIVCGALLIVASYLVDNLFALVAVSLILCAIPYASSRGWL